MIPTFAHCHVCGEYHMIPDCRGATREEMGCDDMSNYHSDPVINERRPQDGWYHITNDPTWPNGDKDAEIERLKAEVKRLEDKVVKLSTEIRRHPH